MDFEVRYVLIRDMQRITCNTSTPEHQPDHQKHIMAMYCELQFIRACHVYCPRIPHFFTYNPLPQTCHELAACHHSHAYYPFLETHVAHISFRRRRSVECVEGALRDRWVVGSILGLAVE